MTDIAMAEADFPSPSICRVNTKAFWSRHDEFPQTRDAPKEDPYACGDSDEEFERAWSGSKQVQTDGNEDGMYLIDDSPRSSTTIAQLPVRMGTATLAELRSYIERHAGLMCDSIRGQFCSAKSMVPVELAVYQVLVWKQIPRASSFVWYHPDPVTERERHIARTVRWIAGELARAPRVFVIQERQHHLLPKPQCDLLHDEKNDKGEEDLRIALEPLLDPGTLHPAMESTVLEYKVLLFRRNFSKYDKMSFFHAKNLTAKPTVTFCSHCLRVLWDQREWSWSILDKGLDREDSNDGMAESSPESTVTVKPAKMERMPSKDMAQLDGSVMRDWNTPATGGKVQRRDSARAYTEPVIEHPTRQARPKIKAGGISQMEILGRAYRATHGNTLHSPSGLQTDFSDTEDSMPGLQSGARTRSQHDERSSGQLYDSNLDNVLKAPPLALVQGPSVVSKPPGGIQARLPSLASDTPPLSRAPFPKHLVPKHTYCYCQRPDNGTKMVQCTNEDCPVRWFHYNCLSKSQKLSTQHLKWVCDVCKSTEKYEKERMKADDMLSSKLPFEKEEVINAIAYPGGAEGVKDPYGMSAFKPAGIAWAVPDQYDAEAEYEDWEEEEYEDEDMEDYDHGEWRDDMVE